MFSLLRFRPRWLRLRPDKLYGSARLGIFGSISRIVFLYSSIQILCYSCIQAIVRAPKNIYVPGAFHLFFFNVDVLRMILVLEVEFGIPEVIFYVRRVVSFMSFNRAVSYG